MNKIKHSLLAIILMIVTILVNVQPASALEEYEVDLGVNMSTAISNWTPISTYSGGMMQYPGQWSYNSAGYIVNAENTSNMTGYYNPTTNYSDMDIAMKMGSWNSDDDYLGCMIRFSEDSSHTCTGYIFMMPNTANAWPSTSTYGAGLYKLNGQQFSYTNLTKCVGVSDLYWTRSAYRTVRIVTSGKNIKVYVDGTLYINYTDTSPIESGSYGSFSLSQADSRFASITGKATLAHYIATFNANGGTLSGSSSKTVTSTKTYGTLPTATRTGYTFAGWYDAKTGGNKITSISAVNIAADTTFYAHWTPNKYKNKYEHWAWGFKNSEGNNSKKNAYLLQTTYGEEIYGEEFTPNASYGLTVPNGYYLASRFKNNQITGSWQTYNFGTKLTQPEYVMNFEYDYYPTDYTITYNLDGGTNSSSNPDSYTVLYGVTFAEPTKKGYDFLGWYDANGNKITGINEGCNATFSDTADLYSKLKTRTTGNISVTAKWKIHDYSITTNKTGSGAISSGDKITYTDNTSVFIIPAEGYTTSSLKIDGVSVSPVTKYNFLNVEADHKVEATFTISQNRKMELMQKGYKWIDLKL